MPELPEVETWRRLAERHLRHRRIEEATVLDDRIVVSGILPGDLARALRGRRVEEVRRKGKHLWLVLDERPWPALHFGMAGGLHAWRPPTERPRFWKLELRLDDGIRVSMTDARRLGRIRLLADPENEPPIAGLGADALNELPGAPEIAALLARRKAPLKAVLLDQTVFAGVGNWIADEVLYQAAIHPERRSDSLDAAEAARLRRTLARVVRKAVDVGADSDRFPRGWLFHRRWGRNPDAVTLKGEPLRFSTVGGRTTAWVPAVQGPAPRTGKSRTGGAAPGAGTPRATGATKRRRRGSGSPASGQKRKRER